MGDLAATLLELLNSDEGAEKLKDLANTLINGNPSKDSDQKSESENPQLPNLELISMMAKIMPLLSSLGSDDKGTALLRALKPHLGKPKQQRVDEAIKIMQLMKMLPVITESGLLRGDNNDKSKENRFE